MIVNRFKNRRSAGALVAWPRAIAGAAAVAVALSAMVARS